MLFEIINLFDKQQVTFLWSGELEKVAESLKNASLLLKGLRMRLKVMVGVILSLSGNAASGVHFQLDQGRICEIIQIKQCNSVIYSVLNVT